MHFETNKEKGNAGLSMGIAYFGSNGYTVLLPLNDTQDYDFVVEKDDKFLKVQCKATAQLSPYNIPIVSVKSSGGTKGSVYGTVKDSSADLLFVLNHEKRMWVIPVNTISNTSTIALGKKVEEYEVCF